MRAVRESRTAQNDYWFAPHNSLTAGCKALPPRPQPSPRRPGYGQSRAQVRSIAARSPFLRCPSSQPRRRQPLLDAKIDASPGAGAGAPSAQDDAGQPRARPRCGAGDRRGPPNSPQLRVEHHQPDPANVGPVLPRGDLQPNHRSLPRIHQADRAAGPRRPGPGLPRDRLLRQPGLLGSRREAQWCAASLSFRKGARCCGRRTSRPRKWTCASPCRAATHRERPCVVSQVRSSSTCGTAAPAPPATRTPSSAR